MTRKGPPVTTSRSSAESQVAPPVDQETLLREWLARTAADLVLWADMLDELGADEFAEGTRELSLLISTHVSRKQSQAERERLLRLGAEPEWVRRVLGGRDMEERRRR
jgi:hypothetical protein